MQRKESSVGLGIVLHCFVHLRSLANLQYISPALPVLTNLIYFMDDEVSLTLAGQFPYHSDDTNDKIQAVFESAVCRTLVDPLMHSSTSVQTPALRSVGSIFTTDNLQTQVVIASSALPTFLSLLSSTKEGIRKEACWTIWNITAGSPHQSPSRSPWTTLIRSLHCFGTRRYCSV